MSAFDLAMGYGATKPHVDQRPMRCNALFRENWGLSTSWACFAPCRRLFVVFEHCPHADAPASPYGQRAENHILGEAVKVAVLVPLQLSLRNDTFTNVDNCAASLLWLAFQEF